MRADPKVANVTSGQPCAMKTSCDSSGACAATMAVSSTAQMPLSTTRDQAILVRTSHRHCRRDACPRAGGAVERHNSTNGFDAVPHVGQAVSSTCDHLFRKEADAVVGNGEASGAVARSQLRCD